MTENRFIQSADEQGYWRIKDTVTGETTQKYDDTACTWLNELNKENKSLDMTATNAIKALDVLNEENKKLKQLLQKIITKEFELSSDDKGYDPLSEFFNNEVNISQIEVDINVEKKEKTKENIHANCENYNSKKDMCLKWMEENVSKNILFCNCKL